VPEQGLRRKFGLGSASFRAVNRRGLDQKSLSARFAPQGGYARWREGSPDVAGSSMAEASQPQRPGIHALVGQLESGCMPQHVRMNAERHPGDLPKPGQHPTKGNGGHRGAALAHKDISPRFLFSLETAQGAKLSAGQRVDGGHAVLQPSRLGKVGRGAAKHPASQPLGSSHVGL